MRKALLAILILFSATSARAQVSAFSVQPLTGERVQVIGGVVFTGSANVTIPTTIFSLTDGATNSIFITSAGVLSIGTSGFGANFPIATVITANGVITSITDNRANGPTVGGGLAPNIPGIPSVNGSSIFYATNYGVKAGGFKFCDANVTGGALNHVTIGNDAAQNDPSLLTLGITSSWIAWVTTWNCSGFNQSYGILTARSTVVSVNSATDLTLSNSASGACNGTLGGQNNKCTLFLFPQDDTTAINSWMTAMSAQGTCGEGRLWSGLALYTYSTAMNFLGGCAADNTGNGSWPGLSVRGEGVNASVLVLAPNSNVTSCGSASFACIFRVPPSASNQNDIHLSDFTIDGGGQSAPTGNACNIYAISLGADSSLENVGIFAWGPQGVVANGSNNAPVLIRNLFLAGVGTFSSACVELSAQKDTQIFGGNIFWGVNGLASLGGDNTFGQTYTFGTQFGFGLTNPMIVIPAGKYHVSVGDYFNNTPANAEDYLQVAGTLDLSGSIFTSAAASNDVGLHVISGGTAVLSGLNDFAIGSSGTGIKVDSGGIVVNTGSILNTSTTPYSVSGSLLGAALAPSTTVTAGKLVLSAGWGSTAAVTALSGANAPIQFTITNSGVGQGASPTITYTFPTAYAVAPFSCTATQTGGTNATGTFTSSALSATGVTFTFSLTPTASSTEIVQVTCPLP